MPFKILRLDQDRLEEAIVLRTVAFEDIPMARVMRPQGSTPELFKYLYDKASKTWGQKNHHHLGVVDTDDPSGKLLAYAHWEFVDADTHSQPPGPAPTYPSFLNGPVHDVFYAGITKMQKEVMGTNTYWTLNLLTTANAAKRRGIGKLLLKWGTDQADAQGLETYLDSTLAGKPLYDVTGFKVRQIFALDLRPYGEDSTNQLWAMVRPPNAGVP